MKGIQNVTIPVADIHGAVAVDQVTRTGGIECKGQKAKGTGQEPPGTASLVQAQGW